MGWTVAPALAGGEEAGALGPWFALQAAGASATATKQSPPSPQATHS